MSNAELLKNHATYVSEKISSHTLSVSNYVTTDNILQNKLGKIAATSLPAQVGKVTKYSTGDILVANIRPYLKKIWYANESGGCSADVLTFRAKNDTHPKFLYYALFRDDFFSHVMKGSKGTKMPRGDKNQIMEFSIPYFDISIQKKIATVFSALDAKIELNNRINAELEAMAKTLYDYWFVQFDFPDANRKPYKTNGGKMTYNPILKRDIPAEWKVGVLSDIANITMGQSPEGESYNSDGNGVIFFQGCTDFGLRFPSVRQFTTQPTRFAKKGDILLSVRAPVGTLNIAKDDCCIGRGLAALNSKDDCIAYLFGVMVNLKQVFDRRNVDGTTFGSITKDDLFSLPVIKPSKEILTKYHEVINPMFKKQDQIAHENQQLIQLRDWLLPMLMNGQIKVS